MGARGPVYGEERKDRVEEEFSFGFRNSFV
jgi:hypothetical protein